MRGSGASSSLPGPGSRLGTGEGVNQTAAKRCSRAHPQTHPVGTGNPGSLRGQTRLRIRSYAPRAAWTVLPRSAMPCHAMPCRARITSRDRYARDTWKSCHPCPRCVAQQAGMLDVCQDRQSVTELPTPVGRLTPTSWFHWLRGTAPAARRAGGRSHPDGQPVSRWRALILQFGSRGGFQLWHLPPQDTRDQLL